MAVPFTFTPTTRISSSQVNTNFSTIYSSAVMKAGDTMTGTLNARTILASSDNTYDLGAAGATRFRDFFLARNATIGGNLALNGGGISINVDGVATPGQYIQFISDSSRTILRTQRSDGSQVRTLTSDGFNLWTLSPNISLGGTLSVGSDFAINTNKFTVTGASGNTAIAGTLAVTGDTNTFGREIQLTHTTNPFIRLTRTSGGTVNWDLQNNNSDFNVTDGSHGFTVRNSDGQATFTNAIVERNRSFAMGATQNVAYSAGNFTATGGTWTVQSGDQTTYSYSLVGDRMTLNVYLDSTTTSSILGPLKVALPAGYTAQETAVGGGYEYESGGTIQKEAVPIVLSGGTLVSVYVPSGVSDGTNNVGIAFSITFKVS